MNATQEKPASENAVAESRVVSNSEQEKSSSRGDNLSQSRSQDDFSYEDSRIVQEVTVINNLKLIRKVDKCEIHRLKQKVKTFLANRRTEFNYQLSKWQEFFDETHDDHF